MMRLKKFNEYHIYVSNQVEDTLKMFMETFYKYCEVKKQGDDVINRALELIEELKEADLRKFLDWILYGKTLVLMDLLRNTSYKGNGNTPELLLDFNAFTLLDTIGMYYREGFDNEL